MTTRMPEGMPTGDRILADDEITEVPERWSPTMELGVTGVKRVAGYVDEEFLPALRGRKAVRVYREMSMNDSMVGALLFTIDKLIREVEWKVKPPDESKDGPKAAEFLESIMDDMSHSWDDFIGEVLSMLAYGWSWHEIVYKRRIGPWEKSPQRKSKFDDGMIGIRKMPIRSQETLMRWGFDESGGIKALVQQAPPTYVQTVIPIEKSLLFRTSISKNNPEGVSLLRTAYRSWYFKKRMEEFEAIGVERDLAGLPVARVPHDYMKAQPGTEKARTVEAFKKMVRGVRRDENEGLLLPSAFDQDTKNQLFEFELMASSGTRTFDTNAIIQRYEQRILMSVLADFILVGHEQTGSYSLHTDKTGTFRAALNAIVKSIADTLNRHLVPRLFALNGWKMDELPKFEPTDIDPPDLDQLAQFISATAGAGMQWFPDPELEKFVRDIARLPEMTEETEEIKRMMYQQEQAMLFAEGQMGLMGLQQKAEMTASGMTPEQAQLAAEQPTPEIEESMMRQQQMANQPPPEDPNEGPRHAREMEKLTTQEKLAQSSHGREKEKLRLQDTMANRDHKRQKEQLRAKDSSAAKTTKLSIAQMREKQKMAAKKPPPAKKAATKKTAKKPPPKRGQK